MILKKKVYNWIFKFKLGKKFSYIYDNDSTDLTFEVLETPKYNIKCNNWSVIAKLCDSDLRLDRLDLVIYGDSSKKKDVNNYIIFNKKTKDKKIENKLSKILRSLIQLILNLLNKLK